MVLPAIGTVPHQNHRALCIPSWLDLIWQPDSALSLGQTARETGSCCWAGSQFMAPENVLSNFKCGSSHPVVCGMWMRDTPYYVLRAPYSGMVATGGNDGVRRWWLGGRFICATSLSIRCTSDPNRRIDQMLHVFLMNMLYKWYWNFKNRSWYSP